MPLLAPEEIAVLDLLIEGRKARDQVAIPGRDLVGRPEKFAFPIGLDEHGDPFPIPPRRDLEEEA